MKIKTTHINYATETHTCNNCNHSFRGKVCNMCGEKIFKEKQLTARHFIHEAIDFFYHWESKVLKTIKLNFIKPGFVTKENLRGVRVPYAKPVQLYLVVAFLFYLLVSKIGVTDYVPSSTDHHYYYLSAHKSFKWAYPIDNWTINAIDSMWVKKGRTLQEQIEQQYQEDFVQNNQLVIPGRGRKDSVVLGMDKLPVMAFRQMAAHRQAMFDKSVGTYSKTLIFILIPAFALLFFLLFFKKIKYYGAALILATHFMVYNLCVYCLHAVINVMPMYINKNLGGWLMRPFTLLFYNKWTTSFSSFMFGTSFEFMHLLFWMPWMYIAFKRLFNTSWWQNLLAAYICSRVFFYLIFGILKKLMIAFTIYTLH
ncbi:MAG: hypothetical protein RL172_1820 [Bacteroidota bacterium]